MILSRERERERRLIFIIFDTSLRKNTTLVLHPLPSIHVFDDVALILASDRTDVQGLVECGDPVIMTMIVTLILGGHNDHDIQE